MKKFVPNAVLAVIVATVLIPQVTFAAWWNPASWGIFSFLFSKTSNVETVENIPVPVSATTTVQATTSSQIEVKADKPIDKPVQKIVTPKTASTKIPEQPKPSGTLCNETYWNSCPVGQNFVCPATGDAYCQVPQQPVQQVTQQEPQKDNYQICRDSYGHASWDGVSYTSSGGPNCSCDTGYEPSADGKSCVLGQVMQTAVPQQDLSINSSACNEAVNNLQKFQTSYTNNYASLSSTIAANNIVQARLQIFANQYNTALPGYQMAAQAACKIPASNNQCQAALQKFDTFQSQNTLSPNNTSGSSQTLGNRQAMELGNYETEIYYACQ